MPNSKTIVQAILAAFCAILCALSSLGGGGMNRRRILVSVGSHTPTAKDYVQDGLIAMWDGIENAGWGVHDPNATVWKDLKSERVVIFGNIAIFTKDSLRKTSSGSVDGKFGIKPTPWQFSECVV